jgi:predicted glycosyltransferase involved in capsule biosynthesis
MGENMKLSFCTTCMNRVEHLKKTLPHNIELLNKFDNSELVIVNYDSKDDLHDYIINNYSNYINNNKIKYIKVQNKNYFDSRHAKNIAHKCSTGDVLINLDADNFLTETVILEIIRDFSINMNYLLNCGYNEGFIVISRDNFFKLGGYNENMQGYGLEDVDLIFRAFYLLGLTFRYFDNDLVKVIEHSDDDRTKNFENKDFSQNFNRDLHHKTMNDKILNPNLYNNIEWGNY